MADILGSLIGGVGFGGNAIGAAIVRLRLDSDDYARQLTAAKTETAAATTGMGATFSKFGAVAKAGVLAAGAGLVAFAAVSVKAASDLGEQINKTNVVFGDNSKAMQEWAKTGAESFGLSERAALEAAGGFGQMLQTAGIAVDESAKLSQSITQLGGDLASFNNVDPTEALDKLRSGLAGEAEPLRQFGIFLSEARVQQEAYQSGIAKVGSELTEAQKIQARYNLIMQDSAKAQGDFARTADSLPNQLRSMRAEFENVSADVGEKLLPVMTSLLGLVRDLIPVLGFLGENFDKVAVAVGGALAVMKGLPGPVGLAITALTELALVLHTDSTALELFAKDLDEGTISTDTYNATLERYADRLGTTKDALIESGQAIDTHSLALEANARRGTLVQRKLEEVGITVTDTGHKMVRFAHMTKEELEKWETDIKGSFRTAIFQLDDLTEQSDITARDVVRAMRDIRDSAHKLRDALREIQGENFIPDKYVQFLSEQGPDWLIAFTDLNRKQKDSAIEAWRESEKFSNQYNNSLDKITGALKGMDNKTTQHTVKIKYEYVGFDPTKPGMAAGQTGGAVSGQQR